MWGNGTKHWNLPCDEEARTKCFCLQRCNGFMDFRVTRRQCIIMDRWNAGIGSRKVFLSPLLYLLACLPWYIPAVDLIKWSLRFLYIFQFALYCKRQASKTPGIWQERTFHLAVRWDVCDWFCDMTTHQRFFAMGQESRHFRFQAESVWSLEREVSIPSAIVSIYLAISWSFRLDRMVPSK